MLEALVTIAIIVYFILFIMVAAAFIIFLFKPISRGCTFSSGILALIFFILLFIII